jgi:hypothetical protein
VSELGETVYVVVDNTIGTADDPFVVDIDVRPSECAPTLLSCVDANTREFCDQFGIRQEVGCYFGCVAGVCNPPTNDTCATPSDLTGGGIATIPYAGYVSDYGNTSIGCTGYAAAGPEAVFSFTAVAGDIATVRLTGSTADASLWITTTCGDDTACIAGADETGSGSLEEVVFPVPADGTYFIMADAFSSAPTGDFTLEFTISPPICTSGAAACDSAGSNVEVCDSLGATVEVFQCDSAGCVAGQPACTTSTGEFPAAAIDANALGMFMGTFASFTNDFDLDSSTSCTGWQSPGADAAYFVDMAAGQTLTATLNSTDDTSLYFMNAYSDPDANCLAGEDGFGSGEIVSYTATAAERIFVIVDAFDDPATAAFTLDLVLN